MTSYLLAICSFLPVFGRLADLWGRKNIFSTGILLFTLGSALCGLAGNILVPRGHAVVQAIGASMLMSSNQAIIVSSFRFRAGPGLGVSGTVVALGSLTGPVLGGFLVSWAGWRSSLCQCPDWIVLTWQPGLSYSRYGDKKNFFDWRGSVFFTLGLFGTLFAVNMLMISAGLLRLFLFFHLGIGLLVAFVFYPEAVAEPLIDFNIYRNRAFMFETFPPFSTSSLITPIHINAFLSPHVLNYSTSRVGLTMAFFPICMAIVAPISGYASDKLGPLFLTTGVCW